MKPESLKVFLDEKAAHALSQMITDVKAQEPCVRITPSLLTSWIVGHYAQTGFTKDRDAIIQAHFNSKEYLKKMLQDAHSQEDIAQALKTALQKVKTSQPTRCKKKPEESQDSKAVTNSQD